MFTREDAKWVKMVLDRTNVTGADDRDREAQLVVRAVGRAIEDALPAKGTEAEENYSRAFCGRSSRTAR
jgi:hypothetical protein